MGQQAIGKGQHGIHTVQRRAAIPAVKEKVLFSTQEHMVKHAEIRAGRNPLQPPQGIQVRNTQHRRQQLPDALSSLFQAAPLHPGAVVPAGALDAGRAVAELSKDHTPGNFTAALHIVSNAVLLPPEKHIAAALSAGPGQKAAPGRAEGQSDAPLGAGPHQRRRSPGIGKADDCLQRVQRIPGNHVLFPVCQDIFPLQRQINVLRGDKQRIQKLLHGISSIAALR